MKIIPKEHPCGWYSGIVHIWDLPEDTTYVDLKKEFKYRLLYSAKGNISWKKFTKVYGINYNTLLSYKHRQRITLKTIWNLLELANENGVKITREHVEKNLSKIGGHQSFIENPKVPFDFNNIEGAKFIASILHDGGIRTRNASFYSNYNLAKKEELAKTANKIFGKIRLSLKTDSVEFPLIVGMVLTRGIGLKTGNKVVNNPRIPEFIFSLDNLSISSYLKQAYDDDGCVVKGKISNNKIVTITCNTGHALIPPEPNLLIGIKRLLESLEIPSQKVVKSKSKYIKNRGYISQEWKLSITGLYSLIKFKELVNFGINYKIKNLSTIIKELEFLSKRLQNPKNLSEKIVLNICKKKRLVDKRILALETNFSPLWTKVLLNRLEDKGYLRKLQKMRYNSLDRFVYRGDRD